VAASGGRSPTLPLSQEHGALDQAGDVTGETDLRASDAGKSARWPVEISFVLAPLILLVMANPDDII
jgi:hypothetical protein